MRGRGADCNHIGVGVDHIRGAVLRLGVACGALNPGPADLLQLDVWWRRVIHHNGMIGPADSTRVCLVGMP